MGLINMTTEPILTLFLLTYNHENSIRKTIESILAQKTKYPFIVKILEDCSTDKTLEICKEYVEKYPHLFKLIAQKVNTKGLHCRIAREKEVNTKYWCFIEGDDWYLNNLWIEKGVSFLEQNQDYNCYCGDVIYSNEAENTKKSCVTEIQKKSFKKLGHDLSFDNYIYIQTSARMYRNVIDFSKIREIPISDIYTWYLFLDKGKVYLEHEIMSQYNITPQGIFSGMPEKEKKERDFYRAIVCNNFFKYKYSKFFAKTIKNKEMKILKFLLGAKLAMKILYGNKEQIKEFATKLKNNKARKKVLLLGGSYFQVPSVIKAKELGYYTITCDYLPDNPAHKFADEYYNVSTTDKEAVLKLAQELKIDGIVCYASDPAAPTAAYVAEKMGLVGQPYKSVEIVSKKDLFRKFLTENGFNVPKANGYTNYLDAKKDWDLFKKPVMVKPVDSSGSKGITKIYEIDELEKAIEYALSFSRDKRVVIEEYVESYLDPINGDGFSINGELVFSCFAGQYFSPNVPNPFTPVSSIWPNRMSEYLHKKVHREFQRALTLLKMESGAYNFEARIDKNENIYLMEIGTRNGGNLGPQAIYHATGIDMVEYTIKSAMGEDCSGLKQTQTKQCCAYYVVHSLKNGKFKEVKIEENFKNNNIIEFYQMKHIGDEVTTLNGSNATVGIMILKFENSKDAYSKMQVMDNLVRVIVE